MAMNPRLLRPRASQQAAPCPYPASLLLHFDGNLTDSSANGLTVTAVGDAATTAAQSKFGGGSLNPDGGWLTIPDHESLDFGTGDFTVECWVRIDGYGGNNQCPFAKNGNDDWSAGYGWELSASSAFFLCAGATITCDPIPTGQWVHLAVTRRDGFVKAYADGLLIGSGDAAGNLGNAYDLTVGNREITSQGGWVRQFVGYIDDLRITKGLAVYDCTFAPPTAPLSACVTPVPTNRAASLLLHFDGNLTDSSENEVALTAYNGAAISTTQSKWGGSSLFLDGDSYLAGAGGESVCDFNGSAGTVEAWVYLTAHVPSGQYGGIVGPTSLLTQSGLSFGFGAGGVQASTYIDAGAGNGGTLNLNQWHHVAYVVESDGVTLNYYLDGVLSGTHSLTGASDQLGVIVGNPLPASLTSFTGYIDDLRITKGLAVYKGPFTPPTAPLPAIATPQPVNASLVLNFDGSFTDESVNALTVTANGGAAISTAEKKFGSGSAYFTGSSSDYATTPSTDGMAFDGDFTIEAWTYWTGDGTEYYFPIACCTGASDASGWLITHIAGAMHFLGSDGSGWDIVLTQSGATIPQNQWSHIAVVRRGSSVTLYIDGTAVASTTSSIAIVAGDNFYLGHYPIYEGATPLSFTGYIDGLRITKAALYCSEFTPPTAPPTPTAVPPCCPASAPPPPSCDPYGTYLRDECQGWDYGTVYADGECGEYFDAWSPCGCGTLGCTDPSATNYNPDATCDDGSCSYE